MSFAVPFLIGVSTGYNFSLALSTEAETRQGENIYLASGSQAAAVIQLGSVASRVNQVIPNIYLRTGTQLALAGASMTSAIACPIFAAVKQKHFEDITFFLGSLAQEHPSIVRFLPSTLEKTTEDTFCYLSDNMGTIAKIGMVVGAGALACVSSPVMAAGILTPIIYQTIDARGWIPINASRIIEACMPPVAGSAALFAGGIIAPSLGAIQLLSYSPTANQWLQQKIDRAIKDRGLLPGPTLEEIDGPVIQHKHLSFEMINAILDTTDLSKLTINPAHCAKSIHNLKDLPQNFEFQEFLGLFKSIPWQERYDIIKKPFFQDKRFISFLRNQFPHQLDVADRCEHYLNLHAESLGMPKEEFLAEKLEHQLKALVQLLEGNLRGKGAQNEVTESIEFASKILAQLKKLNLKKSPDRIALEDTLLLLGVEGGEYCPAGVRRVTKQILTHMVQQISQEDGDFANNYEKELQVVLEAARINLADAIYRGLFATLSKGIKGNINELTRPLAEATDEHGATLSEDIHTYDALRSALRFGITPFSDLERQLFKLMLWENPGYTSIREHTYGEYYNLLVPIFKEVGNTEFSNYVKVIINRNNALNQKQKEAIIDKFTECNEGQWTPDITYTRFVRLVCVILGIIKFDSLSEDWDSIDSREIPNPPEEDWVLLAVP